MPAQRVRTQYQDLGPIDQGYANKSVLPSRLRFNQAQKVSLGTKERQTISVQKCFVLDDVDKTGFLFGSLCLAIARIWSMLTASQSRLNYPNRF